MGPSEAGVGHSMGALEAPGGERLAHAARCARLMGGSPGIKLWLGVSGQARSVRRCATSP